ncbi:MAG TPA: tetratricopeptide repeat protein, partial [Gemmataceae bacterium]|nr:tetratricopeptide repeat protein [Gemmataceae bacterium]
MRYLVSCLLLFAAVGPAHAGPPTLKDANERLLRGNYAEARGLFEAAAKQNKVVAAIGINRAWQSEGQYDKALAVLDAALKDEPANADLLAHRAELLFLRGRWEDAEKAVQASLKQDKDQFLSHWVLAQLYRDRGDFKKSGEELLWFIRTYAKQGDNIRDPDQLLLVCRAELERARGDKRLVEQFDVVLNDLLTPLGK